MTILVFEDNLIWSARLAKTVQALGHQPMVLSRVPAELPEAEAAIVNLGSRQIKPPELIPRLKQAEIYVIAHAGHKETELLKLGKQLGCDRLATNGELTFKLGQLLPK